MAGQGIIPREYVDLAFWSKFPTKFNNKKLKEVSNVSCNNDAFAVFKIGLVMFCNDTFFLLFSGIWTACYHEQRPEADKKQVKFCKMKYISFS